MVQNWYKYRNNNKKGMLYTVITKGFLNSRWWFDSTRGHNETRLLAGFNLVRLEFQIMNSKCLCHILFAATLLINLSSALAIIGENPEQSFLRYGAPIKSGVNLKVYRKAGLEIHVHFLDRLTDSISYRQYLVGKSGKLEEISFEEIAVLLDNNSRGEEWNGLAKQYKEDDPQQKSWACKKIPIQANYDDGTETLSVFATNNKKLREIYLRRSKVDHEKLINTLGI